MARVLINTFREHYAKFGNSNWEELVTSVNTLSSICSRIGGLLYNKSYDSIVGIDNVGINITPVLSTIVNAKEYKIYQKGGKLLPVKPKDINMKLVVVCEELNKNNYDTIQIIKTVHNVVAVASLVKLDEEYDFHRHVYLYDKDRLLS